ncbi:hypothetical protein MBLNU457_1254t1 [Dothideomycetes sp. NU457]
MPGVTLSSNWKILQKRLQADPQYGTKRKQSDSTQTTAQTDSRDAIKRPKRPLQASQTHSLKRRKMGTNVSRPPPAPPTEVAEVSPSTPTEPSRQSSSSTNSLTNQGLHPTNKPGKYLALDCEMVGTGPPPSLTNILARVSLVNYHGEQIYDTYVLPRPGETVTDYRTHVSGIRPHHLQPTTARPFTQVQSVVADLLKDNVLVGHALRNDLDALILSHPGRDIRDTARYAKYRKMSAGRGPPGLRKLSKLVLGLEIQSGEHSSVEDARAAMELFKHERAGFEEEVRRRFGGSGRKGTRERGEGEIRERTGVVAREESVDVESEDDGDGDDGVSALKEDAETSAKKPKKKRKAKKKTRRA